MHAIGARRKQRGGPHLVMPREMRGGRLGAMSMRKAWLSRA
jgi:hypothetical protein